MVSRELMIEAAAVTQSADRQTDPPRQVASITDNQEAAALFQVS